ncbi:MAG: LemA family protein [Planctomycetota bacterium]|jgi:LemA protein
MYIVLIVIAVILVAIVLMYNSLIVKRNMVDNVFSTIDVMLKKRYDLVPNLVEAVKGYMRHERGLLEEVTKLRSRAMENSGRADAQVEIDNIFGALLGRLFMVVENYPDLKASDNFMNLQRTLTELEEQISAARRAYNAAVTDFNTAIQVFPTNILASTMNFRQRKLFVIREEWGSA